MFKTIAKTRRIENQPSSPSWIAILFEVEKTKNCLKVSPVSLWFTTSPMILDVRIRSLRFEIRISISTSTEENISRGPLSVFRASKAVFAWLLLYSSQQCRVIITLSWDIFHENGIRILVAKTSVISGLLGGVSVQPRWLIIITASFAAFWSTLLDWLPYQVPLDDVLLEENSNGREVFCNTYKLVKVQIMWSRTWKRGVGQHVCLAIHLNN